MNPESSREAIPTGGSSSSSGQFSFPAPLYSREPSPSPESSEAYPSTVYPEAASSPAPSADDGDSMEIDYPEASKRKIDETFKEESEQPPQKRRKFGMTRAAKVEHVLSAIHDMNWSFENFVKIWVGVEEKDQAILLDDTAYASASTRRERLTNLMDEINSHGICVRKSNHSDELSELIEHPLFGKFDPTTELEKIDYDASVQAIRKIAPSWYAFLHDLMSKPRENRSSYNPLRPTSFQDAVLDRRIFVVTSVVCFSRAKSISHALASYFDLYLLRKGVPRGVFKELAEMGVCHSYPVANALRNMLPKGKENGKEKEKMGQNNAKSIAGKGTKKDAGKTVVKSAGKNLGKTAGTNPSAGGSQPKASGMYPGESAGNGTGHGGKDLASIGVDSGGIGAALPVMLAGNDTGNIGQGLASVLTDGGSIGGALTSMLTGNAMENRGNNPESIGVGGGGMEALISMLAGNRTGGEGLALDSGGLGAALSAMIGDNVPGISREEVARMCQDSDSLKEILKKVGRQGGE